MKPGDIILVKFPFSDLETGKKRPAVILSNSSLTNKVGLVTIAMVTSKLEGLKLSGDYKVQDWQKAGLLHPSLIRLAKIATVETDLVLKSIGCLNKIDIKGLQAVFVRQFQFWI
jgi:mRNA interferase MazF